MLVLFVLHLACSLHGLDGRLCIATAYVESRLRTQVVSKCGARGLMQVRPSVTPWPEWSLSTTVGGAMAGARALAYWHRHRPVHPLRGYACGWRDTGHGCAEYERKVRSIMRRLNNGAEPGSGRVALAIRGWSSD